MANQNFLVWSFFEEQHYKLAADLESWAQDHLSASSPDTDIEEACRGPVASLATDQWIECCVPAPYGGRFKKLDVRSTYLIRETLARHHPLADFAFARQGLGSAAITLFGSERVRPIYLPQVCECRIIPAFALSEEMV